MTSEDVVVLRKALGFTQTELAERLGMNMRSLQEIEAGKTKVKLVHQLALERIALAVAVERGDIGKAPADVRRDAIELARLITG